MHSTTVKIKRNNIFSSFGSHYLIIVSRRGRRRTQFWTIQIQSKHILFSAFNIQFYSQLQCTSRTPI